MTYVAKYASAAPSRDEIDTQAGDLLLEFGADWCTHCQAAQPAIADALQDYPGLAHVKVEDGKGRPLGRSFQVKLWPSLILLRNGQEIDRIVRPTCRDQVLNLLGRLHAAPGTTP